MGAQVIGLLTLPVLARLFTPEEFGFFSLALALVGIVAPLATLRLESATLLAPDDKGVGAVVWNAIASSVVICVGTAIVIKTLMHNDVAELGENPRLLFWVPFLVMLTALYALFTQLTLRRQGYGIVAKRTLLRAIATAAPQIGLGFARGTDGLLVGTAIGNATAVIAMTPYVRRYLSFPGFPEIRAAWTKYWRFPAIFAPSALLNAAGLQLPLIFFTAVYGLPLGGQLGMAERIIGLPITVIGVAAGQVLQAEISGLLRARSPGLSRMYLRTSALLGFFGLLTGVAFGLLGAWLIPFVLGEQWIMAGHMVQVLALTGSIRLVASSQSTVLLLLQKSRAMLSLDALRVALMIPAVLLVMGMQLDEISALWILYSGLTVTYAVTWLVGLFHCRSYDAQIIDRD